ncbi:hypothetical protein PSEUBRA_002179 [Kalmanozyma brasiliensis GHG001]|uniref:uncharacterized protein n=1 Tax=Kalmanozyma brasiliensis (strain GHG001) TaxID=1365824 RepID=UPI002867D870|nr:uncharacterized protein PSEUBRA_002179 [Kalmanozyma brasiliensis GHG001]EST08098.2 hypothetical protein PSEUBRA_002179 [Kalmanozyma brasiliensis GHG001]
MSCFPRSIVVDLDHHRGQASANKLINTHVEELVMLGSSQGVRIRRSRMVLLAVPALAILLYLYHKGSGSLRDPDSASLTIITKTQLRDYSNALSDAQWARQEGQLRQCRLQWFQSGTICPNPPRQWSRQNKLDAVWPWSNGSLDSSQTDQSYLASMDLLRYSMRSARAHMQTGFGTVNLLTPDVPALAARASTSPEKQQFCTHLYKDASGHDRHGQRPCWFDPKDRVYEPPRLFHHRQVACDGHVDLTREHCSSPSTVAASTPATASQLLVARAAHLSDVRLLVSPHHIMSRHMSASDFWSPLLGPLFRISADWSPAGHLPTQQSNMSSSDDAPFFRANALLDRRFGTTARRRLIDLPQPLSHTILEELSRTWPSQLTLAASASPSSAVDLNTLHAHYMAERYREALLWSFFVARHDRDGDGVYSAEERAALLSELGAPDPQKPVIAPAAFPVRTTTENDTLNANLARLHLPLMTELKPIRTSMDGSALLTPHTPAQVAAAEKLKPGEPQPPICGLSGECVQTLFANVKKPPSVAELFRRMTQAAPNCGQCVLYHLTHKSGLQGLSAFLPPPELTMASIDHLPLVSTWQISDFTIKASPSSRQARRLDVVIDLLSRYSHSFVYEEPRVTPTLLNRTQTVNTLMFLDNDPVSSLFSFKQHGVYTEQTPDERHHWAFSHGFRSEFEPEDPMIWVKIVRAWLSTKFPFLMRFEAKCNGIC